MNDLHFVACQLRKNPGFTALAVLTLVLINEPMARQHLTDI